MGRRFIHCDVFAKSAGKGNGGRRRCDRSDGHPDAGFRAMLRAGLMTKALQRNTGTCRPD